MKTLNEYLYSNSGILLFESITAYDDLQESYEAIGYKMINNDLLCEGLGSWLRKLADKGDKLDKFASDTKDAVKDKIKSMSDAAKHAVENVKKAAGEKWDEIKDTYTSVIATIDGAIQDSKEYIVGMAKKAGQKVEEVEASISTLVANTLAKGGEVADKITTYISDKTKSAQTFAAITTFTLAAIMAKKAGIDSSVLMDLMASAGIK